MKVRPILFNTEMVRAILREPPSSKTATRRAIKGYIPKDAIWGYTMFTPKGHISCRGTFADGYGEKFFKLPCQPGDILYVRETWTFQCCIDCMDAYEDDSCMIEKISTIHEDKDAISEGCYIYRADHPHPERIIWRPSIHMPKAAARIWLKVTDVRVERLQEITEEQTIGEGIIRLYDNLSDADYIDWAKRTGVYPKTKEDWGYKNYLWHGNFGMHGTGNKLSDAWEYQYSSYDSARDSFSSLWNATIPLKDWNVYGWDTNPWVWVIEFERYEQPEPCILRGIEPASDTRPCIGYQKSQTNDEPCEMCKGCRMCNSEDPEVENV